MDELHRSSHGSSSISSYSNSSYFGGGDGSNSIHHHQIMVSTAVTAPQILENHEQVQGLEISDIIFKAQIANHPLYPNLLSAYIDCRKVGAPPEMTSLLEEISRENHPMSTYMTQTGSDPELDDFMKSYCEVLHLCKEELSKALDEATSFLSSIESQLSSLCNNETLISTTSSLGVPSDEDTSCGEVEGAAGASQECHQELKEMLMRKYSGYLSSLKMEFLKKRKKGKLPKDARTTLLHWWNTHYRWPYPTEEEKNRLSEMTGLDQKQINNWFINQRKRHWRPSEDMRFALMEGVSTGAGISATAAESIIYFDPN